VAEMAAAAAAMHLRPRHAMASILGALKGAFDGIVEAWPASAALEFFARHEKPLTAARADKSAGTLFMDERAAPRSFRAMPAHDPVLFLRKQALPFLIGMGDFKRLVLHHLSLRWAAKHALQWGSRAFRSEAPPFTPRSLRQHRPWGNRKRFCLQKAAILFQ